MTGSANHPHTKLWNKDFTLYWLGRAQSTFGSNLSCIALAFLVLDFTGSASAMSLTFALESFPVLLGPLAGTLVA